MYGFIIFFHFIYSRVYLVVSHGLKSLKVTSLYYLCSPLNSLILFHFSFSAFFDADRHEIHCYIFVFNKW